MTWQDLHEQSIIFDWHNHGTLKNFLFDRSLDGKNSRFLSTLFKRSFWPLSERNTLPKMKEGGLDVVLSTSYIPEIEWIDDQWLIKLLKYIYPSVNKRVFQPTYFDATNAMMDRMEKEVENYNNISLMLSSDSKFKFVKNVKELEEAIVNGETAMIMQLKVVTPLTVSLLKKELTNRRLSGLLLEKRYTPI